MTALQCLSHPSLCTQFLYYSIIILNLTEDVWKSMYTWNKIVWQTEIWYKIKKEDSFFFQVNTTAKYSHWDDTIVVTYMPEIIGAYIPELTITGQNISGFEPIYVRAGPVDTAASTLLLQNSIISAGQLNLSIIVKDSFDNIMSENPQVCTISYILFQRSLDNNNDKIIATITAIQQQWQYDNNNNMNNNVSGKAQGYNTA